MITKTLCPAEESQCWCICYGLLHCHAMQCHTGLGCAVSSYAALNLAVMFQLQHLICHTDSWSDFQHRLGACGRKLLPSWQVCFTCHAGDIYCSSSGCQTAKPNGSRLFLGRPTAPQARLVYTLSVYAYNYCPILHMLHIAAVGQPSAALCHMHASRATTDRVCRGPAWGVSL